MNAEPTPELKVELTERQDEILAIVQSQGFVTNDAMARQFDVSAQSIRRDIIHLDRLGLLQRFHGGAGPAERVVRLGYKQKREIDADAKKRMGARSASLLPDGAAVFIDVGTTVEAAALALKPRSGLRIFTSSIVCAQLLLGTQNELCVLGGPVIGADGAMVGESVLAGLRDLRFDFAILGFSGVDIDGSLMDYDPQKVAVKQIAAERSACVMAVGSASKLDRPALRRILAPEKLDILVTDRTPTIAPKMGEAGTEIVVA